MRNRFSCIHCGFELVYTLRRTIGDVYLAASYLRICPSGIYSWIPLHRCSNENIYCIIIGKGKYSKVTVHQ